MRKLTDHKVNELNEALNIDVLDEPGQGGACHQYQIYWGDIHRGPRPTIDELEKILASPNDKKVSIMPDGGISIRNSMLISFQNGPVKEAGVNGISQEALMAVVIDRLRSFQAGEYKCRENAIALTHFEEGLMWLQKRTRDRLARGVEGTNQQ
jgi:hypothetical protein